jgi:uncharacterized protein (TIGR03086 family)
MSSPLPGDQAGPLADDFTFTGPVASFSSADGFRAMASQAGAAVRSFRVRHQFTDGDLVCSVIDWEMAMLPGVLTAAEVLEVRDGTIVRGELIYDAEDLRKAMAPKPLAELLDRSLRDTAVIMTKIDKAGWSSASPCSAWSVRQVGNHLAGSIDVLARIVSGERLDPEQLDSQRLADTDRLGTDPAASLRDLADRALVAFSADGVLERSFDQPAPDFTGQMVINVALLEALVHGWDLAEGAGLDYQPDEAVVDAVHGFATVAIGEGQREQGLIGPAVPTPADADPFTALLGHLGRRAS